MFSFKRFHVQRQSPKVWGACVFNTPADTFEPKEKQWERLEWELGHAEERSTIFNITSNQQKKPLRTALLGSARRAIILSSPFHFFSVFHCALWPCDDIKGLKWGNRQTEPSGPAGGNGFYLPAMKGNEHITSHHCIRLARIQQSVKRKSLWGYEFYKLEYLQAVSFYLWCHTCSFRASIT